MTRNEADQATAHRRNDLLLTIINDGAGYNHRLATARIQEPGQQADRWVSITTSGARTHERQFKPETLFSAADILAVAAGLAEYYAEHLTEL